MNRIPIEVLNQAFLYFNQAQKVECMLVCRQWARAIKTLSLLETVRVSCKTSFEKVIDVLKAHPEQRANVKRLFIDILLYDQHLEDLNPSFFPKLQELYIFDHGRDFNVENIPTHGWSDNIKVLMEYKSSSLTRTLLASTTIYSQLEVLYFDNKNCIAAEIVPYFTNAPALTELYITAFCAEITDYELLHKHLPSLCKLTINTGDITSSILPLEIQPTKCLKSLRIVYVDIEKEEHHTNFLQYIGKKYTNIVELVLLINCKEIRFGQGYELHKDDWKPVFDRIGPQLKTIGIEAYAVPKNFFDILDKVGCHIQNLIIHSICLMELSLSLIESHQSIYVEKLTIDYALKGVTTFEYLKRLPNLRILEVNYSYYSPEYLSWNGLLIECPSTLETLSVSFFNLKYDLKTDQIFSLKELEFKNCGLPKNFDSLISKCIPSLKKLKFQKCKFKKRTLDLPDHDLDEFHMISCLPPTINVMLVETIKNKKKQWYSAEKNMNVLTEYEQLFDLYDAPVYPAVRIIPYEEAKFKTYISLICRSLKKIILINRPLFD